MSALRTRHPDPQSIDMMCNRPSAPLPLLAGVGGDIVGGVATGTGAGAPVGVPVIVVSTAVAVGGVANIAAGIGGLVTALSQGSGGSELPTGSIGASGGGLLKPGAHAGENIPATGSRVTLAQKEQLTKIGQKTGCHSCGTKNFGTRSGKPVGDHQPPTALTPSGGEQKLFPQCATCSAKQGAEVRKEVIK